MKPVRGLFFILALCCAAFAQPTLITVTGTYYNADGSLLNGSLFIQTAPNPAQPSGSLLKTIRIVNGAFSVPLAPSASGTAYTFTFSPIGDAYSCVVPSSGSPVVFSSICTLIN